MSRLWWPRWGGSRFPARAGGADTVLHPARLAPGRRGRARGLGRADLASVDEMAALSRAGVALLAGWYDGPAGEEARWRGLPLAEIGAGELLVDWLQALRCSFLLARAVGATAPAEVVVPEGWRAPWDGLGAFEKPPALRAERDDTWPTVLRAGPGFWRRLRRWRRPRVAPASVRPGPDGAGEIVGLQNYRNRPLLDRLDAAGVGVLRLEPRAEGLYLPDGADPEAASQAAGLWERAARRGPAGSGFPFPQAPGWSPERLLVSLLSGPGMAAARRAAAATAGWRRWLAERRPRAVVGGVPWSGDPRLCSFAAGAEEVPYIACQDGALSTVGVGGLVPGTAALAWGPEGRDWFIGKGSDPGRVAMIGDPYLEIWLTRVREHGREGARQALGLPRDGRVALGVLQNSAPHTLVEDPDSRLDELAEVAEGVSRARDWTLCVKPHPRLPRVDGWSRVAEGWRRVRRRGGRLLSPDADMALAMAAADVYVSHGDTLTLEALASGRPALLWSPVEPPAYHPELLQSDLPRAGTPEELASLLEAGPRSGGEEVLARHIERAEGPVDAVNRLARRR